MNQSAILWLIPALPLLGFAINGALGRKLPRGAVAFVACALPALSFALAVRAWLHRPVAQTLYSWIETGGVGADVAFRVDALSGIMILVVTGVGTLIHVYSIGYMHEDPGFARYFSYLNLFLSAMLVLVMADNLILMFVGWEGVGLCSYLLIGFWFDDLKNADAGKKAFVVNRVGDFGFILGIVMLLGMTGTLSLSGGLEDAVTRHRDAESGLLPGLWSVPALLLFLGACGKSAQIPLHVWLPDAMAGPTPVSALIHAATMVTAGVYMIARLHYLFAAAPGVMGTIVLVAAATALLCAVIAVAQNDIKKILAYSTISQLGFMLAGVATGFFTTGLFHLVTHAFYKALLFLGAGAVIHALHGEQDIRKMGGLARSLPLICILFGVGAAALMGWPGTAGYVSKDAILAAVGSKSLDSDFGIAWLLLVITAFVTAFYTVRMFVVVFLAPAAEPDRRPHRPGPTMTVPLAILAALSLAGGFLLDRPVDHSLAAVWGERGIPADEASKARWMSWALWLAGGASAFVLYGFRRGWVKALVESDVGRGLYRLVSNKFYVDELYGWTVVAAVRRGAVALWSVVDRLLIDGLLVNGSARAAYAVGGLVRRTHTGALAIGAGAILAGVAGALAWLLWRLI